ncbi:MAG: hypothetical protein RI947_1590 [Candidatus Parcubacteria bacterium]|jgi:sugar-specific transcriptional regulator TrmB
MSLLSSVGLSEKEALIYDILMSSGEKPASSIASLAHMNRTTCYRILYDLEKKGLVNHRDLGNKIHFRLDHPQKLLDFADKQLKTQEQARHDLAQLLPSLVSSYVLSVEKPVIAMFEGVKGLKEIYQDTLREKKSIFAVLTTAEVEPELFAWLTSYYGKARARAHISAKVIVSSGEWSKEYERKNTEELRETVMVSQSLFPFQHEVDIYGDKVAFINYKKGDPLIGFIITNKQIAKTMKAWFDLAWKGATIA